MRIIVISDLHGKDYWKEAIKKKADLYVFLGDYIDDYVYPNKKIFQNLNEIIELRKKNNKVILLLGNHDIQYLYFPDYLCTGFRIEMQKSLSSVFRKNKGLFKVAFQYKNYLFTHAGVSKKWFKKFKDKIDIKKFRDKNLADIFNRVNQTNKRDILHTVGAIRGGIDQGGITWADISETSNSFIERYHQIVGHTKVPEIVTIKNKDSSITYTDCFDSKIEFYILKI